MRQDIPLREITTTEIWREVQQLRTDLQTHNHLTFGAQLLNGEVNGILQSPNFVSGDSGYQILPSGSVEFNQGYFRGNLVIGSGNNIIVADPDHATYRLWIGHATDPTSAGFAVEKTGILHATGAIISGTILASSIHIPDENTTANSFHTDSDGNAWWGCTHTLFDADHDNAAAYVLASGAAKFQSITLETNVVVKDLQAGSVIDGTYVNALSVAKLTTGTISSKQITLEVSEGSGDAYIAAGKTDFTNTDAGFILGIDDSDANKAKFYIGDSTYYFNWTGSAVVLQGTINATSGYIGDATDGIQIDSAGLQIVGTGYIATGISGVRIEMVKTVTGGYTDGLLLYDANDDVVFRLINGGWPALTIFEREGVAGGAQILGTTSTNGHTQFKVTAKGLEDAVTIETTGSSARSALAGLRMNQYSDVGYGIYIVQNSDARGDMLRFATNTGKKSNILLIEDSSWAAVHEARITKENYIQFPAYYHCSDFDEVATGGLALASSVIAKAYWVGGGTDGTQIIVADSNGYNTYIKLSTTDTANRSSTITFNRKIAIDQRCVEFRVRISSKTNTTIRLGFYDGSANYAWFNFDTDIDANNIYAECYAGSLTRTDTTVDMNTTAWHTFRIIQYPGPYTYFFIDDILKATITTNTSTSGMKPYCYISNKAAAEEKILYVDFIKIWKGRVDSSSP